MKNLNRWSTSTRIECNTAFRVLQHFHLLDRRDYNTIPTLQRREY